MVQRPAQAEPVGRRSRRRALVVVATLSALVIGGCGGGSTEPREHASNAPPKIGVHIAAPLSYVNCTDWRRAGTAERQGTVRQLRAVATGQVGTPGGRGPALDDKAAYRLFQTYCANSFARAFKLYRLYGRAAGLAGG